jgi:hypothetical protein
MPVVASGDVEDLPPDPWTPERREKFPGLLRQAWRGTDGEDDAPLIAAKWLEEVEADPDRFRAKLLLDAARYTGILASKGRTIHTFAGFAVRLHDRWRDEHAGRVPAEPDIEIRRWLAGTPSRNGADRVVQVSEADRVRTLDPEQARANRENLNRLVQLAVKKARAERGAAHAS